MGEIKAGVTLMNDFCRPGTETFQGYVDYIDREEAQRNNAITTFNLFNEYIGNPYKSSGLFTAEKDSLTLQEKKQLKNVFAIAQTNQSMMWQTVISFDNKWLQKNGIYDMQKQLLDERKLKTVIRKAINDLLKNEGLDQAVWSAGIHYNTDNIHVHVATVEPYPMRKKMMYQGKEEVRGKFKLSNINHCKSVVVNEIMQTREMNLRINTIIRKDIVEKLKEQELTRDVKIKETFLELCQMISKIPKNRMNYGNKEMRQYRKVIDQISEKFLQTYCQKNYYELREILDRQSLLYSEAYGGNELKDYKQNKLQELKEKMGNAVLKIAKNYIDTLEKKVGIGMSVPDFGTEIEGVPNFGTQIERVPDSGTQTIDGMEKEEQEGDWWFFNEDESKYDLKLSIQQPMDISDDLKNELLEGEKYREHAARKTVKECDLHEACLTAKEIKNKVKEALKDETDLTKTILGEVKRRAENNPFLKELLGEMYLYGRMVEADAGLSEKYFADALEIFENEIDSLKSETGKKFCLKSYIAFCVGKQYDRGWGVEEDPEIAAEWYEKSNTEYAKYALGNLYYYGRGVEQDYEKSLNLFKEAEDNPFAKLMCAKMTEEGKGTEKNLEESDRYYTEAFDLFMKAEDREESALFEYQIGYLLYYGKGCEKNETEAVKYLKQAAQEKNVPAILLLSNVCFEKELTEEIPHIVDLLKELSEKTDSIQAQYTLGKIYAKEWEFFDLEKSVLEYGKAAEQGHEWAQYQLGKIYLTRSLEIYSWKEGIAYLELAKEQGNEAAKYRLAKEYLDKSSEAYQPEKGMEYLKEVALEGHEWAQLKLGCEYIKGEHTERNFFQAVEWLEKSADQGNEPAKEILNDVNIRLSNTERHSITGARRHSAMGELDKAMVALRRSLYETQKEMRYNMLVYEQDIQAELNNYTL